MIIKRPTIAIGSAIASLVLVEPGVLDNAPASMFAVSVVEVAEAEVEDAVETGDGVEIEVEVDIEFEE